MKFHVLSCADNEITGDVLINASHDMLKDLNIKSVGHRLAILRAIKQLLHSIGFSAGADGINTTANSPNPAVLSHSTTKVHIFDFLLLTSAHIILHYYLEIIESHR
jgi:hypothetical protein